MTTVSTLMKKFKKEELAEQLLATQQQLEKYNKELVLVSDGTVPTSYVYLNGKPLENLTALRIKMYKRDQFEVSYECMDEDGIERNWVYGEDPMFTQHFKSFGEQQRKKGFQHV